MNAISKAKVADHQWDPNVWGDCVEEAVQRVRDNYAVPYHLLKYIVDFAERIDQQWELLKAEVNQAREKGYRYIPEKKH